MVSTMLYVALGGALGAVLRFLSGVAVLRVTGPQDFPLAILTVNVIGSFLMGVFVVMAAQRGLTHLSPLVMTGLLGGFTTFSAFSLEYQWYIWPISVEMELTSASRREIFEMRSPTRPTFPASHVPIGRTGGRFFMTFAINCQSST